MSADPCELDDDEPDTKGWQPDLLLVPALLAGSPTTMADLCPADRAWAVAGLMRAGHTAERIRDRMGCSLRTVRMVSAWAATTAMMLLQEETEHFQDEYRMQASEIARLTRELATSEATAKRYQDQLANVLDSYLTGEAGPSFPKCGHPKTKYNTYTAPKTGKTSCRMCHCDAQRAYEARKAAAATAQA
ncbi:hypothetical protein SEA_WALELIANO_71 [Mycobacterium phage Waleliano]|uniref:Helix-turn-helix DNA binding domain protein n=4 Tax=Coopervirus brownCNA TaxID=1983108 RepID=A0A5Q2WNW1_9CAUD|nr:hypothetical protein AVV09_gp73 [Mycobacterium phage BrownCNA]AKY02786.1 hypothetical protein SEA_BROWNCNA_73 [Mycobacterium phage BrownCNA]QBI96139.1 hypothetical protein SEA_WALELIANO_71 [Mycobacterium phage Waleliano]QGH80164.1 hypothetical protein SEA_MITHRIL_71 [Mycobacterium phage Mithril]QOC58632.1 HNH endonuclease [Mycobacterium phage Lolalove]